MNQDESQYIEEFFNILHKTARLKGITDVKTFFTIRESNTNNMDIEEFRIALFKLGYDENSVKYNYLMKKYQNYFSKNLINLHVIIEEFEIYNQKYKEENSPSMLTIPSGFNSNLGSPVLDHNKMSSMKSGFHINQATGENLLTPKSQFFADNTANGNFMQTKYVNTGYENGFNKTFPLNENQLNSNPISFRDDENYLSERTNFELNNTQNVFIDNKSESLIYEPGLKNNLTESIGRSPTFGIVNDSPNNGNSIKSGNSQIKDKLQALDKQIKEELDKNQNYVRALIYENFQNNFKLYQKQMEKHLLMIDPKNERFLSQDAFLEFCEDYVILDNFEKNILLMDIVRNASTGKYSYDNFLEKVKNFDINEKIKQTKNFHLNYNDYIIDIRKVINGNNIDIKKIWRDLFNTSAIIDLSGFYSLLTKLSFKYLNEEIEYIFNKIAEDGKVSFRTFESVIKRNPPNKNSMEESETQMKESYNKATPSMSTTNTTGAMYNQTNSLNSNVAKSKDYYNPGSRPVRNQLNFDELKNKPEMEIKGIIEQRIRQRDTNVLNILKYMENIKLFQIYHYLAITFKSLGNNPQMLFNMKDLKGEYYISSIDFKAVLNELRLQLNEEQKESLVNSLPNKNDLYLYSEFLRRVYSYNPIEYTNFMRTSHLLYNDYIIELRTYIKQNNIELVSKCDFLFPKINTFSINQFQAILQYIGFTLAHFEEYRYMFSLMSVDGVNLNMAAFLNILDLIAPDVEVFIEKGNLTKKTDSSKLPSWKSKIDNYTEESAKNFKKNYPHLSNAFADINIMATKNSKDAQIILIDYFDDCIINTDGEIDLAVFVNKLSKLGVKGGLNNLLTAFGNQKNSTFNMVKFFNAYFCFYLDEKRQKSIDATIPLNNARDINESSKITVPANVNNFQNKKSNIVYRNLKREFMEEDIEFIRGVISELTEIILTEKRTNVSEYFKKKDIKSKGYFLIEEFSYLLDKEFDFDVNEAQNELVVLYDYLINEDKMENKIIGSEHIKISSLIEIFKEFAKDEIEMTNETMRYNTTENNTNNKESREDIIFKAFSRFLFNKKIKFSQIFPFSEKYGSEDFIMLIDFKNAFTIANYPIAHEDLEFLVKYFDPYNKMRISLEAIKNKTKQFVPEYFDMAFQNIDREKIINMHSLHKQINNNPSLLSLINQINSYIEYNKLSVEAFFNSFNRNQADKLNKTEFVQNLININRNFSLDDLQKAFNFFDKDSLGYVTLSTFFLYFDNSHQLTHDLRKDKVSISNKLLNEINSLFDFLDKDRDEKITKDEFYQALKSYNENISASDVDIIIKTIDKEGKNYVERKSFVEIMENHLKEQIVLHDEEKEYVIMLFKEEDIDKVGFLTPNQMRHLLLEKLKCALEDYEIDELINEVDVNGDGMIDIDEFIRLLESDDSNETVRHTLRQINLKRKINPMTFLSIFSGLPMNFIPSFIKEQQKLFRILPSAALRPKTDQTGILYEDILKQSANITPRASSISVNANASDNYSLRPIQTKINAKISLQTATGVAIPDEYAINRYENIVGRIIKIAFFNNKDNKLLGNSINLEARWDKEYEDRWYFDEDRNKMFNNNIIVRYNSDDYEYISVIFEFVILIKKENIITETSCGWSSCELKEMTKQCEIKLDIKGGSPLKNDIISKTDVRTKRSGWAKVAQFFSGQVKSQLPISIKPYRELTNIDKAQIDLLPSMIVIQKAAISMCGVYRKFIAKEILNNKFYSLKVIKSQHVLINNFCKIIDCPDAFKLMIELWNTMVVETATAKDKKEETYWENNLIDFVNKIYIVLYADRFEYNELDPTKISVGNLFQIRSDLVDSSVKYGRVKRNAKSPITPIENKTTFKPFSINEMFDKRIDILSKLDELIPVEDRSLSNSVNRSDLLR